MCRLAASYWLPSDSGVGFQLWPFRRMMDSEVLENGN